jgi:hypothetical protein
MENFSGDWLNAGKHDKAAVQKIAMMILANENDGQPLTARFYFNASDCAIMRKGSFIEKATRKPETLCPLIVLERHLHG